MRAERAASCESAGAGREADGRSARKNYGAKRRRGGIRFAQLDAGNGRPPRSGVDGVQLGHRAGAYDEGNRVVEIVVIPIAADPCWIGRVRVGSGGKPEEEGDEDEGAQASDETHELLSTRKPRCGQDSSAWHP
jgi:hypothetical protein